MAYATLSHVEARNPGRGAFTANSKPNTTQVAGFLEEAKGIIDQVLIGAGYAAPVDLTATTVATGAKLVLQNANAVGAFYMSEWAAEVSDRRGEAEDMWQSALKMLRTSELDLPKDASQSNPRHGPVATPPFFTRDMEL